uniref:Uncharacterized protein n=1 Tax=uncultured marine virus TaxID=186617 RepID=A0A0F7L9C0_9VIRU|nr:hypothetical protein [uncultured marine virus]
MHSVCVGVFLCFFALFHISFGGFLFCTSLVFLYDICDIPTKDLFFCGVGIFLMC